MTKMSRKIVTIKLTHSSTLDFLLEVLGLGFSDSTGSGEPGGSVGGLGAFSTSGSGSRGMEGPLETPENNKNNKSRSININICSIIQEL